MNNKNEFLLLIPAVRARVRSTGVVFSRAIMAHATQGEIMRVARVHFVFTLLGARWVRDSFAEGTIAAARGVQARAVCVSAVW